MGTRARVNIIDGNQILVSIYRQFDGYPSGLGQDIVDFAKDMDIVNGCSDETPGKQANGMGCFAAQLIKHLKKSVGNVYIRDTSDESHGEEFSYNLQDRDGKIYMTVLSGSLTMFGNPGDKEAEMETIFNGFLKDFKASD